MYLYVINVVPISYVDKNRKGAGVRKSPNQPPFLRFSSVDMYVSTKINEAIINQSLRNKIFAPIKTNEIAISTREYLLKFTTEQYVGVQGLSYATIYHQLEDRDGRKKNSQVLENFAKEYGTQIKFFGIESVIDKNIIPDSLLYPNRLLLLNFNYTHTADLYIPQGKTKEYWFPINHIHGDLEKPDDIIFGCGDELDDRYGELVKLYNNEHLRNTNPQNISKPIIIVKC